MKRYLYLLLLFLVIDTPVQFAFSSEDQINPAASALSLNSLGSMLTQEEANYIAEKNILTICNAAQQASTDASINVVKLIAEKSGLILTGTNVLSWNEALTALKEKKCDILPWATKTETRSHIMNFTRPFARIKRVVVTRQSESYFRDLTEVGDKVFVMLKNNYAVEQVRAKYPNMQFIYVNHVEEELSYIIEGKAYGTIVSLYSAASLFRNERDDQLKVSGILPPHYDDVVSLATLKSNRILHSILEKSLIATNPRDIEEFMTQGAVVSVDPGVNYQKYWLIALGFIVVVFMLTWWNRYLKNINKKLKASKNDLQLLSITDPLTKIYNRLKMDQVFNQEIKNSERYKLPLSIIMMDIDRFKSINDEFGHANGDYVLQAISVLMKNSLRSNDFLGRWGGEEFLIICPSTEKVKVKIAAEKLRKAIEKYDFSPVGSITASFGVAQWQDGESQEALLSRADKALYRSKNNGRNLVSE